MADLAKHMRIYDASPDDDLVSKREAAIKDAIAAFRKTTHANLLVSLAAATATSFATGSAPDPLGSTVATAIKNKAPSFVRDERELEVAVVGAISILELLEAADTNNTVTVKDILTATLWSALSFQNPIEDAKHEQLRQELLGVARDRTLRRAEISRKRAVPKEVPEFTEGDASQVAKSLNAAKTAVTVLENNAVLDREEIDILWWATGGRSPLCGMAYDRMTSAARGIVRGIELGILLRRVPSQAMRSLALTGVAESEPMTLAELLDASADVLEPLAKKIPTPSTIEAHQIVFPLLSAILVGSATAGGQKKTVDEWCSRAILETGLAALCETPNPRL